MQFGQVHDTIDINDIHFLAILGADPGQGCLQ
jgi:hypothetical protein